MASIFTYLLDSYTRSSPPLLEETMDLTKAKNTHKEIDRRARALAQARRIEAYLPALEERERCLARELEELRMLIADERGALADLLREAQREGRGRAKSA